VDTSSEFAGIRLLFHIGTGKTGTSSIQATLRDNRERLLASGVLYLGLVFEHAPLQKYGWQRFGATGQLHALPLQEGSRQIQEILVHAMRYARSHDLHTVVWSSESFFDRPEKASRGLRRIAEMGATVRSIVYVRRHDKWANSAFVQWGLKHKIYPGPVRPFAAWIRKRPAVFFPSIAKIQREFGCDVQVRNFDTKADVVVDFLHVCEIPLPSPASSEVNQTASGAENLLRALFNTQLAHAATPREFNRAVAQRVEFGLTAADYMRLHLPTRQALAQVVRDSGADEKKVNAARDIGRTVP
jgi:hypothetical protein